MFKLMTFAYIYALIQFFYFYFTRVEFICNAGLVSGVQQSDSVMHTYFLSFTDSLLIWVITEY